MTDDKKTAFDILGYRDLIDHVGDANLRLIGEAVITCSCGTEFCVPAYSMKRRYCAWRTKFAFWRTPYAIELTAYPDEHGMHLIKKARLVKE